jgi:hypothetical protein
MSEYKVKVAGEEKTIASPSLDKTMRITDHVSDILEELPNIFDEIETYKVQYKINHQELLTRQDFDNPNNKEIIAALNIKEEDFSNKEKLGYDEAGNSGIVFYKEPTDTEVIAFAFPKIWKAARSNVIELAALLITKDSELEEHDKRGAVSGLIETKSHFLKYNASLEEILEIISIGIVIIKEQIQSASSSLGKVAQNMTQMLATEEETPEPAKENQELSDLPKEEQK